MQFSVLNSFVLLSLVSAEINSNAGSLKRRRLCKQKPLYNQIAVPTTTAAPVVPTKTVKITKPATTVAPKPKPTLAVAPVAKSAPKAVANPAPKSFTAPIVTAAKQAAASYVLDGLQIPSNLVQNAKAACAYVSQNLPLANTGNFQADCTQMHNKYRQLVGYAPLTWDSKLEAYAQNWANNLANTDSFSHSGGPYGENLFQSTGGFFTCADAIKSWFDEFSNYNGQPIGEGNFESYGHFTQLMWPSTTSVGCAAAQYQSGGSTKQSTVCEYSPAGNVVGQSVSIQIKP
ncbi:Cuticle-degrading protease [Boothiomyces sp. JEL0838]|nr:Cuticle-degrading protease [Boothiomyces sp. JEL0838]